MENHYVTVENREKITISQVVDVDAFDEENLWADVSDGSIELTGEKLNIQKLDLKEGILIVTGRICSFSYTAVSYTHLDVYKRQARQCSAKTLCLTWPKK